MELTKPDYWNHSYQSIDLAIVPTTDEVRQWVESHIPRGTGTCFEIGCFPGRYLAVLGELGYQLNGIDITPRVENDLPAWLSSQGYGTGLFIRDNFLRYHDSLQYDLVASFGFIEHFTDWQAVLKKQCSMVRKGGYLVVEAPNFAGLLQKVLHCAVDAENLKRHNLSSMDPTAWGEIVAAAGFDICFCGYFGSFDFWADNQPRNFLQKLLLKSVLSCREKMKVLPVGPKCYTPYAGLIARRK